MKPRLANKTTNALTLIEVLVAIACLVIIAALLLPTLARTRRGSYIHCVTNLKQIGLSFRMWSNDNGDKFPFSVSVTNGGTMERVSLGWVFPHFQAMSNELNDAKILHCPEDRERPSATNFTADLNDWKVSYFVGVDARDYKPTTILAGDRNLALGNVRLRHGLTCLTNSDSMRWTSEIHSNQGNILLADGSVQQVSSKILRQAFQTTGMATNRLAIP